jgi:hypothetical protein
MRRSHRLLPRPSGAQLGSRRVNDGEARKGKGRGIQCLGALPPLCSCVAGSLQHVKCHSLLALADSHMATGMAKFPVHIGILLLEATCDMAHGLGLVGVPSFRPRGCTKGENLLRSSSLRSYNFAVGVASTWLRPCMHATRWTTAAGITTSTILRVHLQ